MNNGSKTFFYGSFRMSASSNCAEKNGVFLGSVVFTKDNNYFYLTTHVPVTSSISFRTTQFLFLPNHRSSLSDIGFHPRSIFSSLSFFLSLIPQANSKAVKKDWKGHREMTRTTERTCWEDYVVVGPAFLEQGDLFRRSQNLRSQN